VTPERHIDAGAVAREDHESRLWLAQAEADREVQAGPLRVATGWLWARSWRTRRRGRAWAGRQARALRKILQSQA
jgi:hypothetical protein